MGYQPKHRIVQVVRGLSWRARVVIMSVVVVLAGGGALAASAATSSVPVSGGQLQGTVSICVNQASEGQQYVELQHPAPGNCAPGYVQYHANQGSVPDDDSAYVKTSDLPAAVKANDDDSAVSGLASTFTLSQGGQTSTCSVSLGGGHVTGITCSTIEESSDAITGSVHPDFAIDTHGFGGAVTLSLSGQPSWVSLVGSSLHFTDPIGAAGVYHFTVTATGATSGKAVQDFTLTVT